jgi:HAD superfamily hydrolase (TIGR01509 family)
LIESAIFDVDGTLLDTMPTWHDCGARFLAKKGIEAEPGLGDKMFVMTPDTSAKYLINTYGIDDMSVDEVSRALMQDMEDFYFHEAQPKKGALELLEDMKSAGIPMAVATATDGYCIKAAFERLGMMEFFSGIFWCDDYHTTKAEPVIFNAAAEAMNAQPEATWVFEDGLYAVNTASEAGYRTVGVYDVISRKDWPAMQDAADISVRSLEDFSDKYAETIKNYKEL